MPPTADPLAGPVRVDRDGDLVTITLHGRLDAHAGVELLAALQGEIDGGPPRIDVDLLAVERLDPGGRPGAPPGPAAWPRAWPTGSTTAPRPAPATRRCSAAFADDGAADATESDEPIALTLGGAPPEGPRSANMGTLWGPASCPSRTTSASAPR